MIIIPCKQLKLHIIITISLQFYSFKNSNQILISYVQLFGLKQIFLLTYYFAQSAGAVEYTDCFSAEG